MKLASQREHQFTSESVSEGHPDKLADRISDKILDRFLELDPSAKVACETFLTSNLVIIGGEFNTVSHALFEKVKDGIPDLVRELIRKTGYNGAFPGIHPDKCEIQLRLNSQSADIRRGVDLEDGNIGAGDQGLMFGYACSETAELMPLPVMLAHELVKRQSELRRSGDIPWLRPDAKSQVTALYRGDTPVAVDTVVLSTQHSEDVDMSTVRSVVEEQIILKIIPEDLKSGNLKILINPTGRFVIGGPQGDAGLTGRKIIVDTYGGSCPHGGGAFSGKDPSKVDRSGAYAARYAAKNIVAAGLAKKCTVQISYAIGVVSPVSVMVDSHGTGYVPDADIERAVKRVFDLTPAGIIKTLRLNRPIYSQTAVYGHFGKPGFSWEQTDKVDEIREAIGF